MKGKMCLIILLIISIGLPIIGCKEKKSVSIQEEKEKAAPVVTPLPISEESKVVKVITGGHVDVVKPIRPRANDLIQMGGWAADPKKKEPAKGVVIMAGGKQLPVKPQMGLTRVDVASRYKNKTLTNTGWNAQFKASILGKGRHQLTCYALLADKTMVPLVCKNCEIDVVD